VQYPHASVTTISKMKSVGNIVRTLTRAQMGDRLATIDMGRKWGGAAVGAVSPLGPQLTQCSLGRGLPLYQVAS